MRELATIPGLPERRAEVIIPSSLLLFHGADFPCPVAFSPQAMTNIRTLNKSMLLPVRLIFAVLTFFVRVRAPANLLQSNYPRYPPLSFRATPTIPSSTSPFTPFFISS